MIASQPYSGEAVETQAPSQSLVAPVQGEPQRLGPPAPQTLPGPQSPHAKVFPQSSTSEPQSAPTETHDTSGTHPHWFGIPPLPQTSPSSQSPQKINSEQPSEAMPQDAPSCMHVFGAHDPLPHLLGPAPPQVCPVAQPPQSTAPPQPSRVAPQFAPSCTQVLGTQSPVSAPGLASRSLAFEASPDDPSPHPAARAARDASTDHTRPCIANKLLESSGGWDSNRITCVNRQLRRVGVYRWILEVADHQGPLQTIHPNEGRAGKTAAKVRTR